MIPPFNLSGVLPPYTGSSPAVPSDVSPYDTTMKEITQALASTADRAAILRGFIALRSQLNGLGIVDGYQWCAGSFCEDIEKLENRSPRDMDIVTFFARPPSLKNDADWLKFVNANTNTFDPTQNKSKFFCDAYFVDANTHFAGVISQVTYWHGLFGHRRSSHLWKGMLRVPLVSDDGDAINHLNIHWP